jgi:hypothetical protein
MSAEACGVCGNTLFWWRSRSGYLVCMRCCPDPWGALETLGRRVPGGATQVHGWWPSEPQKPLERSGRDVG